MLSKAARDASADERPAVYHDEQQQFDRQRDYRRLSMTMPKPISMAATDRSMATKGR